MNRQTRWRRERLAEGLCSSCGQAPLAVDKRPHMKKRGRLITLCRACANRKRKETLT